MLTNDKKRQIITGAGYTICTHGIGTFLEGWYALLPGETEFKDELDEGGDQNYVGFFSNEQDLLDELHATILEEQELAAA